MFARVVRTVALTAGAILSTYAVSFAAIAVNEAPDDTTNVVGGLSRIATIGSTVDPINGDQNPYGLDIAPVTAGGFTKGDLIVCNFNDSLNIQGLGTTLEAIAPVAGAHPRRLAADPRLTGCAALVMGPAGNPWVAAYTANDNPILSQNGAVLTALNQFSWTGPFGQTFSPTAGPRGAAAFYESNALDGSIVRINVGSGPFTFDKIVTGLPVNHGAPGNILGPSGLNYDVKRDRLYIVDGARNQIFALSHPGTIPANGIRFTPFGFAGPAANAARLIFFGAPLNAPISSALLFNGHLVIGNTADNNLVEITPRGRLVGKRLLDAGNVGALFGIVGSGTSRATQRVYFNDDNDNTVKVLY